LSWFSLSFFSYSYCCILYFLKLSSLLVSLVSEVFNLCWSCYILYWRSVCLRLFLIYVALREDLKFLISSFFMEIINLASSISIDSVSGSSIIVLYLLLLILSYTAVTQLSKKANYIFDSNPWIFGSRLQGPTHATVPTTLHFPPSPNTDIITVNAKTTKVKMKTTAFLKQMNIFRRVQEMTVTSLTDSINLVWLEPKTQ